MIILIVYAYDLKLYLLQIFVFLHDTVGFMRNLLYLSVTCRGGSYGAFTQSHDLPADQPRTSLAFLHLNTVDRNAFVEAELLVWPWFHNFNYSCQNFWDMASWRHGVCLWLFLQPSRDRNGLLNLSNFVLRVYVCKMGQSKWDRLSCCLNQEPFAGASCCIELSKYLHLFLNKNVSNQTNVIVPLISSSRMYIC